MAYIPGMISVRVITVGSAMLIILTGTAPAQAESSTFYKLRYLGIRIDADNFQDCQSKGIDLVRQGKSPDLIRSYCDDRYNGYIYCSPKKLSADELSAVRVELFPHRYTDGELLMMRNDVNPHGDPRLREMYVVNGSKLHLTQIVIIATDSTNPSYKSAGQANLDHLPPGTTSSSSVSNNVYQIYNGDGHDIHQKPSAGYADHVELVSAQGCTP